MALKVCKFGGSSVADADQIRKVQAIITSDPDRRYIVVSAPGKRHADDRKITDLLYLCHAHAQQGIAFDDVFNLIADRYRQIAIDLGLKDVAGQLDDAFAYIQKQIAQGASADYAASRGEFLNGVIRASVLGFELVHPDDKAIHFDDQGNFEADKTQAALSATLGRTQRAVIPGFYGAMPDGTVKTFSRGGSDVTGAIVARAANASVYENWTDVSGLLMADPRVVDQPKPIDVVTYRELRELSYMGATVLHDEAIFPVRDVGIPVNIRNTNEPDHPGSMIISETQPIAHQGSITGIAGRRNFTVIAIEKAMMNAEIGFGRRLLTVLESNGISYEHTPSGIDTISVIVSDQQLDNKLDKVLKEIDIECRPDKLTAFPDMALIATVGRGMAHTPGMAARLFGALANANVNIRMIDQGSSEINIIVGVENSDFQTAVRAIYDAFVN